MKIVQERIDKENYLEVSLAEHEFDLIKEYMIVSKKCLMDGEPINIGVKLLLEDEESDAFST